jgi:hypothetical protein
VTYWFITEGQKPEDKEEFDRTLFGSTQENSEMSRRERMAFAMRLGG